MKKINLLVVCTGAVVGLAALLLTALGNPGNMGFCIACFLRDISGALGLHSAAKVQYVRPEIIGLVLGSAVMALATGEFKARAGSAPALRFLLGGIVMVGALAFLGCPLRMVLRLGGGDVTAIAGLAGFVVGILVGVACLKKGFSLGRAYKVKKAEGFVLPGIMVGANLQVILRQMLEHFLGNTHILSIIGRSNPQTQNICAIFLHNLLRTDAIACRLGHLLALFVHNHTMGNDSLIRCLANRCNRSQHGRLEPATILVVTFQIYIHRNGLLLALFNDSCPAGTRVKPYVHGVGFLIKFMAATFTLNICRQNLCSIQFKPRIGALFTEQIRYDSNRLFID